MIELPAQVVPNSIVPALIDFGGVLRPPLGGKIQRVDRLGNRFRVSVTLPPLPNNGIGRVVVSRLIRAKTEGLRIEWQLIGVEQGSPGAPLVDGADQAGYTLAIKGCRPGYGVSEGFWFSVESGSQHFLYNVAAPGAADADGKMSLALAPPLRRSPGDNDVIHLQKPMVEGLVIGDEQSWEYSLAHHVGIQFDIEEAE